MTYLCRSLFVYAVGLLIGSALCAQGAPAPASMVVGAIKAASVRGDVKKVLLTDKSETPLRNGDTLIQDNAIVTTGADASAILVFANGATVRVGGDSRLEIKEFLMDPLQAEVASVAELSHEPTVSRTHLRLEFGEMVGNVKTLNRAQGSTFSVSTPAGAAGIRGTIFRIVYRPAGNGQAFTYQLSTSEGVVLFEGVTPAGPAALDVPLGQEVNVIAQVDPATNVLFISAPTIGPGAGGSIATIPLSPSAAAALQTATVQIVQTQQQTRFTQVDLQTAQAQQQQQQQTQTQPQNAPNAPMPPPSGEPGTAPNQPSTPTPPRAGLPQTNTPPLPPPPPPPLPRTTPGDGR